MKTCGAAGPRDVPLLYLQSVSDAEGIGLGEDEKYFSVEMNFSFKARGGARAEVRSPRCASVERRACCCRARAMEPAGAGGCAGSPWPPPYLHDYRRLHHLTRERDTAAPLASLWLILIILRRLPFDIHWRRSGKRYRNTKRPSSLRTSSRPESPHTNRSCTIFIIWKDHNSKPFYAHV
ncbi:hypothetical protein EVAR_65624_1 [Eumeta japonica]|uniref:Uncharacterized protein n=1 Tax=Eumeta variegata TaxID=151549 RepID=A0A4C1Z4K2_EUMVA|nr:hypothetical protein EVAR_65624_1 [Eumeta japonica]